MAGMINFENDMIGFLGMKYWCQGLFYSQNQSFEVFPFGMVYIDRMVGRLGELMEDSHFSP